MITVDHMHSQRRDSKHQHCYGVSQAIGHNDHTALALFTICELTVIVYRVESRPK